MNTLGRLQKAIVVLSACLCGCSSPTIPSNPLEYSLVGLRADAPFPAPADSPGMVSGELTFHDDGRCRRSILRRFWVLDSSGVRLAEASSNIPCRWRTISSRKWVVEWESGTPVGWDQFLIGPDSAIRHSNELELYIYTGVRCFAFPCLLNNKRSTVAD